MPKLQKAIPEENVLGVSSNGVPQLRKIRERINVWALKITSPITAFIRR
jgi:hypothetical protein